MIQDLAIHHSGSHFLEKGRRERERRRRRLLLEVKRKKWRKREIENGKKIGKAKKGL